MQKLTRVEIKYRISVGQFEELMGELSSHIKKDEFFSETVHNIYFDNENDGIIRSSIEKPFFKDKLRLRGYTIDGRLCGNVYFELKKKYNGVVYKRRVKLSKQQAEMILEGGSPAGILPDNQITREIAFFLEKTACFPKIHISYDRVSFAAKTSPNIRITFDTNIQSRLQNLGLSRFANDAPLLPKNEGIFEIKTSDEYLLWSAYPLWLTNSLARCKIYPTAFSKYGEIFKEIQKQKKEVS